LLTALAICKINVTVFETVGIVLVVFFRPVIKNTDQNTKHTEKTLSVVILKPLRYRFEVFPEHG
jgi:membrane protein implicated in regulation of membrane protease activity